MTSTPCTFLQWDSEFFGFRIARVNASQLDRPKLNDILLWCQEEGIDCLYFLADSDDPRTIQLAEDNHFRFQDIRVTLSRPLTYMQEDPTNDTEVTLRTSRPDDWEILRPIARTSYVQSRFYHDPCFSDDKCAEMYEIWLRKSLLEDYADAVVIAEYQGQPIGFVTCHLLSENGGGQIGLVGIADAARGQGIGKKLVHYSLNWFSQQGIKQVRVVTQGRNIAAQRLYQSVGFLTHSVQLWYHVWLNSCDDQ